VQRINALADEFADAIWQRTDRVQLVEIVEQLLIEKGYSDNDPEIIDNFDRLKRLVSQGLTRRIFSANSSGLKPRYRFADFDDDYLIPLTTIAEDELRNDVAGAIGELSWRAFERLCAAVLAIHGARSLTASGSKEEGIDIFGLLSIRDLCELDFWYGTDLRIAGQSKKGIITEPMVRLFARDLESLRQGQGRGFAQSPIWFKNAVSPVVGFMFTSSTVARTAKSWADSKGIVIKGGRQLVEVLVKAHKPVKGFGYLQDELVFDKRRFLEHFEQSS